MVNNTKVFLQLIARNPDQSIAPVIDAFGWDACGEMTDTEAEQAFDVLPWIKEITDMLRKDAP